MRGEVRFCFDSNPYAGRDRRSPHAGRVGRSHYAGRDEKFTFMQGESGGVIMQGEMIAFMQGEMRSLPLCEEI
jgi:hypothetical protein